MRPNPRLAVGAVIIGLLLSLSVFENGPALAAVSSVTAAQDVITIPNTTTVTVEALETNAGPITVTALTVSGPPGTLTIPPAGCIVNNAQCTVFPVPTGNGTNSVIINTAHNGVANSENLRLVFTYTPGETLVPITVVVQACQAGVCASDEIRVQPAFAIEDLVVVVTAEPNVVVCGGVSRITASVRDLAGHPLPGFGYHFYTDHGLLVVGPPRTADASKAEATLTIFPGMTAARVFVEVGLLVGGVETWHPRLTGDVTVQQFCPSHTTAPGVITLKASQPRVHCGGSTFIAATVKDVSNNFVPDGTIINFMANAGTVEPASAETRGGVLNVRYTADANASGVATVTAVGGATFGKIEIILDCAVAPATTGGGAPPRPVCIGDGICIVPPSTGDGSLRDSKR